ncbi:hypothetical protein BD847_2908 [Flavobacterium cutihirudinis]|uniref:Lipoprotein n=1 Tax=Flavobacterium cutihirudinis TaxID=1265740 RepID=A0A3D9FTE7_9FLAO|nr:hypothetical protein [Flavobacterium cutihirudinis]RED23835.1 hypothetical protein BD847_2908 [Flavobacterium cutihirudinis]
MKKPYLLFFFAFTTLLSCIESKQKKNLVSEITNASKPKTISLIKQEEIDSILPNKSNTKNESDRKSPITIVKSSLSKNLYSDHKDIKIIFKNSGKKAIKAIKLEWQCLNSFNEHANGRNFYGEGTFEGKSTSLLKPGQIQIKTWEDFSTDASKITKVRANCIVFTDGTKWEIQ